MKKCSKSIYGEKIKSLRYGDRIEKESDCGKLHQNDSE
jgi:hypothetical protein